MASKKEFILPTLVLSVICVVASAALAFTNQITAPLIAAAQAAAAREARLTVLPEADDFTQISNFTTENVVDVYEANNGAGYAITASAKGYAGDLQVMVGITADGTIADTQVMISEETPGLGSRVAEEPYRSQFRGKDANLEGVDMISGSTVSSGAFEAAVDAAFKVYAEVSGADLGVEAPDPRETMFPGVALTPIEVADAVEAYRAENQGYLLLVTVPGYNDSLMEVYAGVDAEGKNVGVALGANGESVGVGTRVGDPEHTSKFVGKDAGNVAEVDVVSGATTSSGTFLSGVEKALSLITPEMLAELEVTK
ncbi:MAG: FMN-binding protein [Oscillospiraceae bacterium]|nr:FMN-binding protein [Oscillospiraceae bacterium]